MVCSYYRKQDEWMTRCSGSHCQSDTRVFWGHSWKFWTLGKFQIWQEKFKIWILEANSNSKRNFWLLMGNSNLEKNSKFQNFKLGGGNLKIQNFKILELLVGENILEGEKNFGVRIMRGCSFIYRGKTSKGRRPYPMGRSFQLPRDACHDHLQFSLFFEPFLILQCPTNLFTQKINFQTSN